MRLFLMVSSKTSPLSYNLFSIGFQRAMEIFRLDLRHNNLTGKIPRTGSLLSQSPTAFSGNPNLCGFPLQKQFPEAQNWNLRINPENPKKILETLVLWLCLHQCGCLGKGAQQGRWQNEERREKEEKWERVKSKSGKFVVLDEGFGLELEDLLRASAYIVGKGRSGIVYKVVVGRGSSVVAPTMVAEKCLSEGDGSWRFKDFEAEVEAIGKAGHPNLVILRA
ncbi:LOW QUALITY PROTEIN: hypothetical protein RJ641_027255 [Dillenia turbinata]|uniref:Protein kinase domain-containing protein n=1 Tax=Dillenia turbinata TaxID=194707 RepID=A0AAN8W8I0_9MAGN